MRFFAITALVLFSCVPGAGQFADLVVVNARIRTMDGDRTRAEALAVRGGRFVAVGATSEIDKLTGPSTVRIDAGGRILLPGFNDSHVHLYNTGIRFFSLNLGDAGDAAETIARIRHFDRFLPAGVWLRGNGWDDSNRPTIEQLNSAAPDRPVFLYARNPKFALANSAALKKGGIADAKLPLERAELAQIAKSAPGGYDRLAILETALRYAAAYGVTSLQDVSSDDISSELRLLERQGKLLSRVYDCVGIAGPLPGVDRDPDSMVRTGCLKHVADGDGTDAASIAKRLAEADRAGIQILLHAIGPRANQEALGIFETIVRTNGRRDRRLRVEHAQGVRDADLGRFRQIGAIASMQPALFANGSQKYTAGFGRFRDSGIVLAFGSDAAMIPIDPFEGIRAAVFPAGTKTLNVDEAIAAYTANSAFAEFQERHKGSIAPGNLADFVIVSGESFRSGAPASVLLTVVGGRIVYRGKDW